MPGPDYNDPKVRAGVTTTSSLGSQTDSEEEAEQEEEDE